MLNETVKVIERKVAEQREIYHKKLLEDKLYALKLKDATNADQIQSVVEKTLEKQRKALINSKSQSKAFMAVNRIVV